MACSDKTVAGRETRGNLQISACSPKRKRGAAIVAHRGGARRDFIVRPVSAERLFVENVDSTRLVLSSGQPGLRKELKLSGRNAHRLIPEGLMAGFIPFLPV